MNMHIELIKPPFLPDFEALIPLLYQGMDLAIKQRQPYAREHLSAGFLMRDASGACIGRVALYHNPALQLDGKPVVCLGAYACVNDQTASTYLLQHGLEHARQHFPGAMVVGPMDGSTWQTYRFVTSGGDQRPFLLEPFDLPYYPDQWLAAGFKPLMHYTSHLAFFDASDRTDFSAAQLNFESKGLVFRHLDVADPEAELRRLARFNLASFQSAFLFSPITEAEFMDKNRALLHALQPELVHLALDGNDICAMILAYPDLLDPSGQTAVVKTLARLPGDRYRGIGDLLCAKIVDTLLQHGYNKMIHALMRSGNASLNNSSRFWGEPFKGYSLFSATEQQPAS